MAIAFTANEIVVDVTHVPASAMVKYKESDLCAHFIGAVTEAVVVMMFYGSFYIYIYFAMLFGR